MSEADNSATGGSIPSPALQDASGGLEAIGAQATTPRIDQEGRGDLDRNATGNEIRHLEDSLAGVKAVVISWFRSLETSLNDMTAALDSRISYLEKCVYSQFSGFEKRFDVRIDGLEKPLGYKIDGLGYKINGNIDCLGYKINGNIDCLGYKVDGLGYKVDGLGYKINGNNDALGYKIDALTKTIVDNTANLKEQRKADLKVHENDLKHVQSVMYLMIILAVTVLGSVFTMAWLR
jgi:hypothetical protein